VGYTPNMAGAVWVGDPAHKRQMYNITIGGRTWDKVYGGKVPGPIWRDMMTGALQGKPVENFNLVNIPDDKSSGDRGAGRNGNGNGNGNANGGQAIGGLLGGLTAGGTTAGTTAGATAGTTTGTTGGQFPTPTFSIPQGWVQGNGNGGNANGGRRG
jgi:membrane peptidoglycan carboxypeptidase